MRQPETMDDVMRGDPMFAHREDGAVIRRVTVCECGKRFTQRLLSERFLRIVERHSKRASDFVTQQIPDYYVPVHCPPCERRDIVFSAALSEPRAVPDDWSAR